MVWFFRKSDSVFDLRNVIFCESISRNLDDCLYVARVQTILKHVGTPFIFCSTLSICKNLFLKVLKKLTFIPHKLRGHIFLYSCKFPRYFDTGFASYLLLSLKKCLKNLYSFIVSINSRGMSALRPRKYRETFLARAGGFYTATGWCYCKLLGSAKYSSAYRRHFRCIHFPTTIYCRFYDLLLKDFLILDFMRKDYRALLFFDNPVARSERRSVIRSFSFYLKGA